VPCWRGGARAGHCVPGSRARRSPRPLDLGPRNDHFIRGGRRAIPGDADSSRAFASWPRPSLRPHPGHALPRARTWARWRRRRRRLDERGHRPRGRRWRALLHATASEARTGTARRSVTSPTVCCPACYAGGRARSSSCTREEGFGCHGLEAMSAGKSRWCRGQRRPSPRRAPARAAGDPGDRTAVADAVTAAQAPKREPALPRPGAGPLIVLGTAARRPTLCSRGWAASGRRWTEPTNTHPYSRAPAELPAGLASRQVGIHSLFCALWRDEGTRPGGQGDDRKEGTMNFAGKLLSGGAPPLSITDEGTRAARGHTRAHAGRSSRHAGPRNRLAPRNSPAPAPARPPPTRPPDGRLTGSCGSSPRPTSPLSRLVLVGRPPPWVLHETS